ncbi:MAG: ABC transporter ATP-binding protein [Rhodospirillales bacterium]|nr:ABC transporter ATP-binding protein [Rhodospirillales bacterium]
MPAGELMRVRDLTVDFALPSGPLRAVNGLGFRVRCGGAVALVGESGSGKSVTAQAILGILPRTARISRGEILLAGSDAASGKTQAPLDLAILSPDTRQYRAVRGRRISMIFQEPMTSLSPLHTIGDQVSEALLTHVSTGRKDARRVTIAMLGLVGFPDAQRAYDAYPFELSGGLRQRAMIAMALICRPALLIADEPSTALDVTIQAQILKLIDDLRSELGMALLLITHDLGVVANVAEEVVVMYRGRVVESGMLGDLFRAPQHPYLKALLAAVPHFDMKPGERLRPLREIRVGPGHLLTRRIDHGARGARDQPLLDVAGVSKTFRERRRRGLFGARGENGPGLKVVDDVSLRIERGSCLGLVGESGCGKTTVSKVILRAIEPDAGSVIFDDGTQLVDLVKLDQAALKPYRRRIQYVFQDPFGSLDPRMNVFDIVAEPLIVHRVGDHAYRRELVAELMRRVGLDPRHLGRYPHSFSGGQRQRIGIARALALQPDLLICDEPVSALDVSVQAQILNLLKDLQQELGLTYLFISHNLAVVDYMAERIAVMCAGRIVEEAPRETLFRDPLHPYTRALLAAVPYPDPARRLDFAALMGGRASSPAAWPPPFDEDGAGPPGLYDLGGGHRVRAHSAPPSSPGRSRSGVPSPGASG